MTSKFVIGLDLGQSQDYTALSILERVQDDSDEPIYNIRRLERIRGEPYPSIVEKIKAMLRSPSLAGATLVIDQTGVGAAVVDMFIKAALKPIGISIHGGDRVSREGLNFKVPKRDLVGVLMVLLQNNRLKISDKLKLGPVLQKEMLNFKVKIDPATSHDSYSAWREAEHDDLVLSVALACWYGEYNKPTPILSIGGSVCSSKWRSMDLNIFGH